MSVDALSRGARGGSLTLGSGAARLLIQLVSVVVLSRMLSPADFGLVAMVSVFMSLADLIRDFGMPTAALQAKVLSHQQASNLFWINSALGALAAALLVLGASPIAGLYGEPRLLYVVPAAALVVVLNGVQAQLQVQLARRMRYATLALTDVVAQVVALITAITAAAMGAGYVSLVLQLVTAPAVALIGRWAVLGWRPNRPRRKHDSRGFLTAGSEYGAAYLLTYLSSNVDTLIIGATSGASALGYYNRAYQMLTAPMARLLDPLTQVVIPTLNAAGEEHRDFRAELLRVQFAIGLGVVTLFAVTAGVAPALLPLLLGGGWEESVPIFRILAIGGSFWAFSYISYWAFIASRQSRHLLYYNLVTKPLTVTAIIIGSFFGLQGVAWGYTVGMVLSLPISLLWLGRLIRLPVRAFAANAARVLFAGLVGAFTAGLFTQVPLVQPVQVLVGGAAGACAIFLAVSLTPRGRLLLRAAGGSFRGIVNRR